MGESEKRSGERVTINKEFESFDAFIQEYVTNISRTGVFIKTQQPLAVGTRVNLRFTVIMDDIDVLVRVVGGCHSYPRSRWLEAPALALCRYAVETNKKLVFGGGALCRVSEAVGGGHGPIRRAAGLCVSR